MKNYLFILVLLFSCSLTFAQREETLFGDNGLKFSGIWGGWTNTFSSIDNENIYFTGGYGGLEFGRRILVGYAGERLVNDTEFDAFEAQDFEMRYSGLLLGYAFNSHKLIHPRFTVLTGKGKIEFKGEDDAVKETFFTIQPALGIELNIFKWIKLGLQGGYRFAMDVDTDRISDNDLSEPFGSISLNFGLIWGRN
jgi:hypothetical protein